MSTSFIEKNCKVGGSGEVDCTIPGYKDPSTGIKLPSDASYKVNVDNNSFKITV